MPFTFSHPAIVLPFLKNKKLSATALIIGAMSPDFEYFLRMKVQSNISHTFLGLFLFNLPIGLFVAILFHTLIKKPLIDNSFDFIRNRLYVLRNSNWIDYLRQNFIKVLISILIGTISHVIWDSFTHETGYFVREICFLQQKIRNIPLYKVAQHLSSLIGMVLIFYYLFQIPVKVTPKNHHYLKYWSIAILFAIVSFLIRYIFNSESMQIGNVIVSFLSSSILAITLTGLIFKFKRFTS